MKYVLFFYISTSRSMCAVPDVAVFFLISAHNLSWLFSVFLLPVFGSVIWCVPVSHHIISRVFICCLFLFEIILSRDIWFCSAWCFAAFTSLSVSPFRSSLDSHLNVSSWLKCCLFMLLMHWTSFTWLSHFFYTYFPNIALMCWIHSLFVSLFSFDWF